MIIFIITYFYFPLETFHTGVCVTYTMNRILKYPAYSHKHHGLTLQLDDQWQMHIDSITANGQLFKKLEMPTSRE